MSSITSARSQGASCRALETAIYPHVLRLGLLPAYLEACFPFGTVGDVTCVSQQASSGAVATSILGISTPELATPRAEIAFGSLGNSWDEQDLGFGRKILRLPWGGGTGVMSPLSHMLPRRPLRRTSWTWSLYQLMIC